MPTILPISDHALQFAARELNAGKLVAFPTETVYGLGGNALDDRAVASIYAAKGRPEFNPLIVHVRDMGMAKTLACFSDHAEQLAQMFWPGALTLVLPRVAKCPASLLVSAGMDTIALRMPSHPLAQRLLAAADLPLAAPSANRSGRVSPTSAAHVAEELAGQDVLILDGGLCPLGIESTILDATSDRLRILRHGTVTQERLERELGIVEDATRGKNIEAPGMMRSHYAPALPVRLNVNEVKEGEGLLAFGTPLPGAATVMNLSESENLEEAAANLFRMLRALDQPTLKAIAVMPIPMHDLGRAINDRLARASNPREDGNPVG